MCGRNSVTSRRRGTGFMSTNDLRTTISVNMVTKSRLDRWRAPGQCYDGFLSQLVELWERMHIDYKRQREASAKDG
jgi:hypothetical protein